MSYGVKYNCDYLEMNNQLYIDQLRKCEQLRKRQMSDCIAKFNNRTPARFFTPLSVPRDRNIWDSSPLSRLASPIPTRKLYDDSPVPFEKDGYDSDMMEF
jgi:hypothetical protein